MVGNCPCAAHRLGVIGRDQPCAFTENTESWTDPELKRYGMPIKAAARTPLSEYSVNELTDNLNDRGFVVASKAMWEAAKKAMLEVQVPKKCYKPCYAAKPEPIDLSNSWNPDYDDHG